MARAIARAAFCRYPKGVIPTIGEISQPFGLLNEGGRRSSGGNGCFLRFLEFGTPIAMYWASRMVRENKPRFKELPMSIFDYASNRAVAAVFALSVSAMFMAAAIIPASPAGLVA
tara:strand:- start:1202 stop:1546 length:345 start_codon:yes stop_codon:yes gene_type:complete